MKFLRVRLEPAPAFRHPMHEFVVEREGYGDSELLDWMPVMDGTNTMIFRTTGDPDPYREALSEVSTLRAFEVADGPGDRFYTYAEDALGGEERDMVGAFARVGLVLLTPVVFRTDGSIVGSVVGPADVVQSALDAMPDGVDVEVLAVSPYRPAPLEGQRALTERQREAVEAAVEIGYYRPTREGTVEEIAAELGCATGTAAEHLRRAEAKVMERVVR
jgi:hypothetical protein